MMNIRKIFQSMLVAVVMMTGALGAVAAEVAPSAMEASALTVNVNTADAEELADLLNGIGLSRAQAIIEYREQHGPFQSADELVQVRGIGQATLEKNLSVIRLK